MRTWAARQKLLALAALSYAVLVILLAGSTTPLSACLRFAHRAGRQAYAAWRPSYRLRGALANLGQRHTPRFQGGP